MLAVIESRGPILREYLLLTKPGIILGNLISFLGGFFLASGGRADILALAKCAPGIALVMASGCICNNLIDRDIDRIMTRTRRRSLVTGAISLRAAGALAAVLGAAGFGLLASGGGLLTAGVVLSGLLSYVVLYSLFGKRHSVHGTLIGSLAGATAPVAGYCAARGQFDRVALALLLIFCLWQMPHALAIAIARLRDYAAARIPVLPVVDGIARTKRHILSYIIAFLAAAETLPLLHVVGGAYAVAVALVGAGWLRLAWTGRTTADDRAWARGVFGFSLVVVLVLSLMMAIDGAPAPAPPHDLPAAG